MPSSPEYRDFTPINITTAQAHSATYGETTATDGTEEAALIVFINLLKASHINPWGVLMDAAMAGAGCRHFRVRI